MGNAKVYVSYAPEQRDHGLAVSKILNSLGYAYVDGNPQSLAAVGTCSILLRVRAGASLHNAGLSAVTGAFLDSRRPRSDSRIVDLIIAPGEAVWPETLSCPISYVNAVTQAYPTWVRELERAFADVPGGMGHTFAEDELDDGNIGYNEYAQDGGDVEYDEYDDGDYDDYLDEF